MRVADEAFAIRASTSYDDVLPAKLPDASLWHYTSAGGALGVLESRALRLGPVQMMNDEGELDYGLVRIGKRLQDRAEEFEERDGRLVAELKAIFNYADYGSVQQLYVACASTDPESLSQIRGYGEYIIGVNGDVELRVRVPDTRNPDDPTRPDPATTHGVRVSDWRPVCYNEHAAEALIDRVVTAVADIAMAGLRAATRHGPSTFEPLLSRVDAAMKLVACAAFIKHPAFESEREVRILANVPIGSRLVELRDGKYGITPYVTVEAVPRERRSSMEDGSFITAVKLGPGGADPRSALFGLERALDHLGYRFAPQPLAIPFRTG